MINNLYIKATPTTAAVTWGSITGTLSSQTDLQSALNAKQNTLTLTTTGTSGAATLVGATLNIPQYGGGGGASGIHGYMLMSGTTTYSQLTHVGFPSVNSATNRMVTYPFIPAKTFTCSSLYINVITAAPVLPTNVCRILIYSNLNDLPDTKLYESANLPLSTTGQKTAITSFVFTAGTTYWLTLHTGINTAITALTSIAMLPLKTTGTSVNNLAFANVDIASSPTTFPTAFFQSNNPPFIGITIP